LLRIDAAKRRAAEQLDGKFVVHKWLIRNPYKILW
jgi:hypothetical protein